MIDVRWLLIVGGAILATGCETSAPRPEILCLTACSITPGSRGDETPMPRRRPAPVAMAVTFVPTAVGPERVMKARYVVDMLNSEGAISLRQQVLDPGDLVVCTGEVRATINCLADIAAKGGPQAVAVIVEHPGWVSMDAQVTCVGPDPAWAQIRRMILVNNEGTTQIVREPLKAAMAACLIGALQGPAPAE